MLSRPVSWQIRGLLRAASFIIRRSGAKNRPNFQNRDSRRRRKPSRFCRKVKQRLRAEQETAAKWNERKPPLMERERKTSHSAFDLTPAESFSAAPSLTPEERKRGRRFLYFVRRKNATRQIAEKFLAGSSLAPEDAANLIQLLGKPSVFRWREARLATWALGFVPASDPQQKDAAEVLGRWLKKLRWPDTIKTVLLRQTLFSAPLTIYFAVQLFGLPYNITTQAALICGFLLANGAVIAPNYVITRVWDDWKYSLLRRAAAQSLIRLRAPDSVAPLAAVVNYYPLLDTAVGWRRVRQMARESLPRVLPVLRPDHYLQLDPAIVPDLCLLASDRDEELACAALDALGKIGDGRAVVPVQQMAIKHASPWRREIANAILPLLAYRQQQENSYTNLLRASSAPVGADTLLRPASGESDNAPETLLRASDKKSEK